jgi:hypothetical protein
MRKRALGRRTGDLDLRLEVNPVLTDEEKQEIGEVDNKFLIDEVGPIMDASFAHRRALSWEDYNRRRAESPNEEYQRAECVDTIDRLRMSVDNFNKHFPPVLADIYAELPDELMELQERVLASPLTEQEILAYVEALDQLHERAIVIRQQRPTSWRQQLRKLWKIVF